LGQKTKGLVSTSACMSNQSSDLSQDEIPGTETVSWTLAKLPLLMFQRFIVKDNVRSIGVK
jgi:hypothetical protein